MALLPETSGATYPTPRQIENGEPQGGGPTGLWNEHAAAAIERTNWLRRVVTTATAEGQALIAALASAAGFAALLAENGYLKLPSWLGGVIIQWSTMTANNGQTVAFPIAFPTACWAVAVSDASTSATASFSHIISCAARTVAGFTASVVRHDGDTTNSSIISFIAIGK